MGAEEVNENECSSDSDIPYVPQPYERVTVRQRALLLLYKADGSPHHLSAFSGYCQGLGSVCN